MIRHGIERSAREPGAGRGAPGAHHGIEHALAIAIQERRTLFVLAEEGESMWKPRDIEKLSLAELRRIGAAPPETLYEMHALAEWARRAVRGEERLELPLNATIAALTEDAQLFSTPSGMLAAAVFHETADDMRGTFWAAARARLDNNSLERLERAFGSSGSSQSPVRRTTASVRPDMLTLWTYPHVAPLDEVGRAMAELRLPARIDTDLTVPDTGEVVIRTERPLSRVEIASIVRATTAVVRQTVACTLSSQEGDLGPDAVMYAEPGAEPMLGRVDLRTDPPRVRHDQA